MWVIKETDLSNTAVFYWDFEKERFWKFDESVNFEDIKTHIKIYESAEDAAEALALWVVEYAEAHPKKELRKDRYSCLYQGVGSFEMEVVPLPNVDN